MLEIWTGVMIMPELTFQVADIQNMPNCAVVKTSGAIDAKTVVIFQEKLDELQGKSYKGFILDMEGIKYVNSTGLGTLVNVADALESKGGAMALIRIHPKVRVVFDMLGLNNFFKIFSSEEEARDYIKKCVKTQDSTGSSTSTLAKSVFPLPVICQGQNCKTKLAIPKAGNYKCPKCTQLFKVTPDGQIIFVTDSKLPAPPPKIPIQFRLACTEECTEGLTEFVGAVAGRISFGAEDINNIKLCIREICSAIIEKAHENKIYMTYNVEMIVSSTSIQMQFIDTGKYIFDDNVSFQQCKRIAQEFTHKENTGGNGNIIIFIKKLR